MAAFGLKALHPSSTATDDKPHILGYSTARTTAGLLLLDVWNGSSSSARKFTVDKDGNVGVYSNIKTDASSALIGPNTSDAADNKQIALVGGGAATSTRGAYVTVNGNESAGTGALTIEAGDVVGGNININTGGSNAGFVLRSGVWFLGASSVETSASRGDLVLRKDRGIRSVNNAGNDTFQLIGGNTSDQVVLAAGGQEIKWGSSVTALGGGSSATLGTIGGSGPATATQQAWLRIITAGGTTCFFPVWV